MKRTMTLVVIVAANESHEPAAGIDQWADVLTKALAPPDSKKVGER